MDFLRSNIRRHGNDWDCGMNLADVHGCRYTIQTRHYDVHEDHIEPLGHAIHARVCFDAVWLTNVSGSIGIGLQYLLLTESSTSQPIDFKNFSPIFAQVGSSSTSNTDGFRAPQSRVPSYLSANDVGPMFDWCR